MSDRQKTLLKFLAVVVLMYFFFVALGLMGSAFKTMKPQAKELLAAVQNPFVGLFVGILATSLIQSSSTTTAMIVGMVVSGIVSVGMAVPMIMGANIGTSVTNTLVSLGHINRRSEFRRAMACSTVHDVFNLLSVAVLLPIELLFHPLEKMATAFAGNFSGVLAYEKSDSFLKVITKPVIKFLNESVVGSVFESKVAIGIAGVILAGVILFAVLYLIVKVLRSMVLQKVEVFFDSFVGRSAILAMGMGMVITVMVQSSSITTSMLVPMAGAGIITLRQAFPITLGANIGTTCTALIASMAPAPDSEAAVFGLTIACVHLFFNLGGILVWYPLPFMRALPINLAKRLSILCAKRKRYAVIYILAVFFVVPGILVGVYRMFQ